MPAKKRKTNSGTSIQIGGSVQGSNIVVGNNNTVINKVNSSFNEIYKKIERHPHLTPEQKEDAKGELKELETEMVKGDDADEGFIKRRLRNLQCMSPDIMEVAIETLKNPISGVATVIQKVVKKMAEEAK